MLCELTDVLVAAARATTKLKGAIGDKPVAATAGAIARMTGLGGAATLS